MQVDPHMPKLKRAVYVHTDSELHVQMKEWETLGSPFKRNAISLAFFSFMGNVTAL